jgi:hydrogenase maturation protease
MQKAESIAKAVLYEGYMLYPYRASSTKNRQRATFGTLYPKEHPDLLRGTETCRNQAQCLVRGTPLSSITVRVRFLQLRSRVVEARVAGSADQFQRVDVLAVGTEIHQTWDEAVERTVQADVKIGELLNSARTVAFEFPLCMSQSDLRDSGGELAGRIRRKQLALRGSIRISVEPLHGPDLFRMTAEIVNATPVSTGDRESALLQSLVSAHTILSVCDGAFISLLDPPEDLRESIAGCKNVGVYPVLVGDPGEHEVMLASPIILYDYPQVAPESAGDFFDSTEMDEMLTFRVMTLTDAEKDEMRNADDRVRELLERTESTARAQLARTHGAIRSLRPVKDDAA